MSANLTAIAPSSSSEKSSDMSRQSTTGSDTHIAVESSPTLERTLERKKGQALLGTKRRLPRVKPPKDSKIFKVALAIIAMRAQGIAPKEISETLGYSEDTLRQYLSKAHTKGWINFGSFSDPNDQIEYVLKHKVTRNLNEFLDDRDKDVTIEAAKGTGLFKSHQVVKGEGITQVGLALRVQVEMPPTTNGSAVTIRPGSLGGSPGYDIPVDAEIVEEGKEGK